jgi:hypothetical protein
MDTKNNKSNGIHDESEGIFQLWKFYHHLIQNYLS